MNRCLSGVSLSLISEIDKIYKSINFYKLLGKKKLHSLKPYYNKFIEKYKEIDNKYIIIENLDKYVIKVNKSNMSCNSLAIIKYLRDNPESLKEIFDIHKFDSIESKETQEFINSLTFDNSKKELSYCTDWINNHGTKLTQSIYNILKMKKIPYQFYKEMNLPNLDIYGPYASFDIQDEIEKNIDSCENYTIKFKNITLILSIKTLRRLSKKELEYIIKRCLILDHYHNLGETIHIEFIQTKNLKKIPKNYKLLGPKEINSASASFSYNGDKKVCIWREEESRKLIIHELIHYHRLDFHSVYEDIGNDISKHFNINPVLPIKIFEAYTEVWALIINCILCSCDLKKNSRKSYRKKYRTIITRKKQKSDRFNNFNEFKLLLDYELKYSLFQLAKILNFYGFKNTKDFVRPYDNKDRFKQSTHVFSYFFVKSALLFHIDEFINFLNENIQDNDNKHSINIKDNFEVSKKFTDLIIRLYKNENFLNIIDELLEYIISNKIKDTLRDTLRMTCVELK